MSTIDRTEFLRRSSQALRHIDDHLGALEHDGMDVELAADVLSITFDDGAKFVINAHSAAGQVWMAAGTHAWHFDWLPEQARWVAARSGDELMATVARVVGEQLGGETIEL